MCGFGPNATTYAVAAGMQEPFEQGGGFARLFQLHLLFSAAKENILFTDSCYCDNTSSVVCTAMCDVADHGKAASYCHNS